MQKKDLLQQSDERHEVQGLRMSGCTLQQHALAQRSSLQCGVHLARVVLTWVKLESNAFGLQGQPVEKSYYVSLG